jgi:hypothetical protein
MRNKFSIIISLLFFISLASCNQFVDSEFGAFDIQDNRNNDGETDNPDQDTFIEVFLLGSKMVFVGDEALINVTLPSGTDVSNLAPDIVVPEGATVIPASGEPQDFTNPVIYTVTLSNGASKSYTVKINVAKATTNELLSFAVGEHQGVFEGDEIYLVLPYGSSLLELEPVFSHNGASVSPELGTKLDFVEPVNYTVTAENGATRVYAVFMSVALSDEKDILSFSILDTEAEITGENLLLTVPYRTSLLSLSPTIVINGEQISPASGEPQDFTDSVSSPIIYTVTAADGTTREYFVRVIEAPSDEKEISSFEIEGISATIDGTEISLTVPYGTNVSSLAPSIEIIGASLSPASGVAQNFTNPVTYTVTAEDGTTVEYTVTVMVEERTVYEVGDIGPAGGYVFYDKGNDDDGWQYMEQAPSHTVVSLAWQDPRGILIGGTSTAIGTGASNTRIVADWLKNNGQSSDRAAIYCDELEEGGKDDWFLPSKGELQKMHEQSYLVVGSIWVMLSSSEASTLSVWSLRVSDSIWRDDYSKNTSANRGVYCARAF